MNSSILDKIRQADNLPSLPMVALQVLQLTQSADASVPEIARVVENDPALTSKILKVANSTLFGMPRQIASLQQAVVVLGLRTVKVMALTFSLVEASQGGESGGFDYKGFWRRSLTTAVAGRLLAQHVPACQADELFAAALLSDIGMLAAFHADKEAYCKVLAESETAGVPIHLIEKQHFGVTHEAFSSLLLETWGLPQNMVTAIAGHHLDAHDQPPSADASSALLRVLGSAVMIAEMFCSRSGATQLALVKAQVPKLLSIGEDKVQTVLNMLDEKVQETAAKWAIDIGGARSFKDIQGEAVVELAKLTMAVEIERAQLAAREQELSSQNRTLAHKATTDGLTGIANRITLEEHLEQVCAAVSSEGRTVGMLLLDLDRFKRLNDTFGHQAGDTALRSVGEVLKSVTDARRLAARYGGEEFAVIVTNTNPSELRRLAEEVRLRIQQIRIPVKDRQIGITVSIGAALVTRGSPDRSPAALIACADKCLYNAKETGRNRVVFTESGRPHGAGLVAGRI